MKQRPCIVSSSKCRNMYFRQVREEWRAEVERSLKKINQLGSANGWSKRTLLPRRIARASSIFARSFSFQTAAGSTLWMHFSNSACAMQRESSSRFAMLLLTHSVNPSRVTLHACLLAMKNCNTLVRHLLHRRVATFAIRHFRLQAYATGDAVLVLHLFTNVSSTTSFCICLRKATRSYFYGAVRRVPLRRSLRALHHRDAGELLSDEVWGDEFRFAT